MSAGSRGRGGTQHQVAPRLVLGSEPTAWLAAAETGRAMRGLRSAAPGRPSSKLLGARPEGKGLGYRVVVDDLHERERTLRVGSGEQVRYLVPVLEGFAEPRKRRIVLAGQGASVDVFGLFLGHADAALQLTLDTIHAAPQTRSTTLFKGALAGKSVFDINGVIRMTKVAHGADAYLEERALLLSPDALATAIPSLEIEANDVKCRHAAAAGPVDPDTLLYLRSRGLSVADAEAMLVRGFLQAVLRQLPQPWQKKVERLMEQELVAARF